MSGHTKGPWREFHNRTEEAWKVIDADGRIITDCGMSDMTLKADKANARLIAAAPDLLEVVKEARTTLAMLKRNVVTEIARHGGLLRWEGVPEAIQTRIDDCEAAITRATEAQP